MTIVKKSVHIENQIRLATSPFNYWWRDLPLPQKFKPTPDAMLTQMGQAGLGKSMK